MPNLCLVLWAGTPACLPITPAHKPPDAQYDNPDCDNILHGGLQVENEKNIPDKDLEDTGTPPIAQEKLVRERGAGSGERGAGISSPIFLEF
jgi:hypothetical protein